MKKLLVLSLTLLMSLNVLADSWENMTKSQAKKVLTYLDKNPYVLDYCDCCGTVPHLVKVVGTELAPSRWEDTLVTIQLTVETLAKLEIKKTDNVVTFLVHQPEENLESFTLSMNYTFGYDLTKHQATPFFNIVPSYEAKYSCSDDLITRYPDYKLVGDKRYKKWLKKAQKHK
ncbi:MAG: hypothetical protein ACWA41_10790 [Putridiphycobacter sp.]